MDFAGTFGTTHTGMGLKWCFRLDSDWSENIERHLVVNTIMKTPLSEIRIFDLKKFQRYYKGWIYRCPGRRRFYGNLTTRPASTVDPGGQILSDI